MQKRLIYKIAAIGLLFLLLQIPLWMVEGLIQERTRFRADAREGIAQSWTGAQGVVGPVLVVPYLESATRQIWDENQKAYRQEVQTVRKQLFLLPDALKVSGSVQTEERRRGLYGVPVYTADLDLEGSFSTQPVAELLKDAQNIRLEPAFVTLAVSDLRGIVTQPRLHWQAGGEGDGREIEFRSGSRAFNALAGMHAVVGEIDPKAAQTPAFSTRLTLRGMEQVRFAAMGKDTQATLRSPWQHPSFVGHYLPREHRIDDTGFEALWQASSFSGDLQGAVERCGLQGQCGALLEDNFGVSFITPVDIYQQGERSVKYGALFVGLTFLAFFLFEVLRQLRLHAMHYTLVGLALATFYLLLISLSEHLGFGVSYLIATLGCTGLLAFYLAGVMRDVRLGLLFAGKFLLLYGMLYGILQSEDNALLMGSLLLFAVLGAVMSVTRRLDWFEVGEAMGRRVPSAEC